MKQYENACCISTYGGHCSGRILLGCVNQERTHGTNQRVLVLAAVDVVDLVVAAHEAAYARLREYKLQSQQVRGTRTRELIYRERRTLTTINLWASTLAFESEECAHAKEDIGE